MKNLYKILFTGILLLSLKTNAQKANIIDQIIKEVNENSQLEILGQELLDGIGPRLVGTPQMKNAHDWAVQNYSNGVLLLVMNLLELGEDGKEVFLISTCCHLEFKV